MEAEGEGDRRNAEKTTSENGQDLTWETPYGKLKIERNGELWLRDPLLRPDGSQI